MLSRRFIVLRVHADVNRPSDHVLEGVLFANGAVAIDRDVFGVNRCASWADFTRDVLHGFDDYPSNHWCVVHWLDEQDQARMAVGVGEEEHA